MNRVRVKKHRGRRAPVPVGGGGEFTLEPPVRKRARGQSTLATRTLACLAVWFAGGVWKEARGGARSYLERTDGSILPGTEEGLWRVRRETIEQLSGAPDLQGTAFVALLETRDGAARIGFRGGVHCFHADGVRELPFHPSA